MIANELVVEPPDVDAAAARSFVVARAAPMPRRRRPHPAGGASVPHRRRSNHVALDLPCRRNDPELWFAEAPADLERAKALCADCPIRLACLAVAFHRAEFAGVWGGHIFDRGRIVPRKRGRGRPRKQAVQIAATAVPPSASQDQAMRNTIASAPSSTSDDRIAKAAARLYDAECALHVAHQSHVDEWITAADRRLHDAVTEYLVAAAHPAGSS